MKKAIYLAAAATAIFAMAPSAQAATYVCGTDAACTFSETPYGTGGYGLSVFRDTPTFDDYFQFTLSQAYKLTVSLTSGSGIFNYDVRELLEGSEAGSQLGTFTNTGEDGQLVLSVGAGTYLVHVKGALASGLNGGTYNGTIELNPVPEPASWAMMIAGIAAVGFTMRRRATTARMAFS